SVCNSVIEPTNDKFTCGFGRDSKTNAIVCYTCCADRDRETMRKNGKIALYLTTDKDGKYQIVNFPSSLKLKVLNSSQGKHNIAGTVTTVWFKFENTNWIGKQYGNSS